MTARQPRKAHIGWHAAKCMGVFLAMFVTLTVATYLIASR